MNFEFVANKAELIKELNHNLQKLPSSQLVFEVKGAQVKLKQLKLTKIGLTLDKLFASIAVNIAVVKKTMLTDMTADGIIEIGSYIDFSITPEWKLDTTFHYAKHSWLKSPDVNIGLIQFPVESIVDNVINKQKAQIEATLNTQLESISNLSQYMKRVLPFVNQSFKLQSTSFQIVPQIRTITVNDVTDTDEQIKIHCTLNADPCFKLTSESLEDAELPEIIIEKAV